MFPSGDSPQITSSNTADMTSLRPSDAKRVNSADETETDQEIRRQQQKADRLGEYKKQGKPLTMSGTASYDVITAT